MPRSTGDSDQEVDVKPARKTRLSSTVTDSPLRRSTRSMVIQKQNDASPESSISDMSNASSTQNVRVTRQRAAAMGATAIDENNKTLCVTSNSISSDVVGTPRKTRGRSILFDAAKTNNRKRLGSEATSSPQTTRVTRTTRATSVDPDGNSGNKLANDSISDLKSPSPKSKRRISVVPAETTPSKSKKDSMKVAVVQLDCILPNITENSAMQSVNPDKQAKVRKSFSTEIKSPINQSYLEITEVQKSERFLGKAIIDDFNNLDGSKINSSISENKNFNDMQDLVAYEKTNRLTRSPQSEDAKTNAYIDFNVNNEVGHVESADGVKVDADHSPVSIAQFTEEPVNIEHTKSSIQETSKMNISTEDEISENRIEFEENNKSRNIDNNISFRKDECNISQTEYRDQRSKGRKSIEKRSFHDSINTESRKSLDATPIPDIHDSSSASGGIIHNSEHRDEINNLKSNTSTIRESSDAHMSTTDVNFSNAIENDVGNITLNSQCSAVTETLSGFADKAQKIEEQSDKPSILQRSMIEIHDSGKTEKNENDLLSNKGVISKQAENWMETDSNDSDSNAVNLFQDIPASKWKEKNALLNKDSIWSLSAETLENQTTDGGEHALLDKDTSTSSMDANKNVVVKVSQNSSNDLEDTTSLISISDSTEQKEQMNVSDTTCKFNINESKTSNSKKRKSITQRNSSNNIDKLDISSDQESSVNVKEHKSSKQNSARLSTSKRNSSFRSSLGNKNLNESRKSKGANMSLSKSILFNESSSSSSEQDDESHKNTDSDIEREYNLHGKSISKFSDDDVAGDECRASETESSDPDDDGSDLADFVVNDDEVEEEESESEEEQEEEKGHNQDVENTESETEKNTGELTNDEIENMKTKEEVQIDQEAEEEFETGQQDKDSTDTVKKSTNEFLNISSIENNRSRKSSDLNLSEIAGSSKKKKQMRLDQSKVEESMKENDIADISLSLFETKQKRKKRASRDFKIEDTEEPLNESQPVANKKLKELNSSMHCSTPKSNSFKHDKLNISIEMPRVSLDNNHKNLSGKAISDKEGDSFDRDESKTEKNASKRLNKTNNNESLTLVPDANVSKNLSANILHFNETEFAPCSTTPTAKILEKKEINKSTPTLKLHKSPDKNFDDIVHNNEEGVSNDNDNDENNIDKSIENRVENESLIKEKKKRNVKKSSDDNEEKVLGKDGMIKHKENVEKEDTNNAVQDSFQETFKEKKIKVEETEDGADNVVLRKKKKKKIKKLLKGNAACEEDAEIKTLIKKRKPLMATSENENVSEKKLTKKRKKTKENILQYEESAATQPSLKKKQLSTHSLQEENVLASKLSKKKKRMENIQKDTNPISSTIKISSTKLPKKKKNLVFKYSKEEKHLEKEVSKKKKKLLKHLSPDKNILAVKMKKKKQNVLGNDKKTNSKDNMIVESNMSTSDSSKAVNILQHATRTTKANKEAKQKKEDDYKKRTRKDIEVGRSETVDLTITHNKKASQRKGVPVTSVKRRKISTTENPSMLLPSTLDLKTRETTDICVENNNTQTSCYGSTTVFSVTDLHQIKKKKKHSEISHEQTALHKMSKPRKDVEIERSEIADLTIKRSKTMPQRKSVKRLPEEVLDNLPDVPITFSKRRKILTTESACTSLQSKRHSKLRKTTSVSLKGDTQTSYVSTTVFNVIDLEGMKRKEQRPEISSFKEKMFSKKSRQPVSSYLMYLEKQRASGKGKLSAGL